MEEENYEKFYVFSPFDNEVVDEKTGTTALVILAVLCFFFVAGLIGHFCVVAFISRSKSRASSSCSSAYVFIGNLTAAHVIFLVTCLPAMTYASLMKLVTSEWIFGGVACRILPFMKLFLLGVTALSFIAFAIDRFRSASQVNKGYECAGDSWIICFCKLLVLWIGALVLATPELLLWETSTVALPIEKLPPQSKNGELLLVISEHTGIPPGVRLLTKDDYESYRKTYQLLDAPSGKSSSSALWKARRQTTESMADYVHGNASTELYVKYETCIKGNNSWKNTFPEPIFTFMEKYSRYRSWWILAFYFFIPVFFALLFALLVSRRLSIAVSNMESNSLSCAGSYYITGGLDGGTLTSQRDAERAALVESSTFRTDSLLSNRTLNNDQHYQQRGGLSLDRQMSQSYSYQQHPRLPPIISTEELQDASPTAIVSNGSTRTPASYRRDGELSPLSPTSPSLAFTSGVSVLSLATSVAPGNGGGTLGTASLPPHGHRRSIKRSSRVWKQARDQAARERSLNSVFVSLVLAFTLTQLPLRVVSILRLETNLFSLMENHWVELVDALCMYSSIVTYIINPIVLCFSYKLYRHFLTDCSCCYLNCSCCRR